MSKASRTATATEIILELLEAISSNERETFLSILKQNRAKMANATVNDAYLQGRYIAVLENALDKFTTHE